MRASGQLHLKSGERLTLSPAAIAEWEAIITKMKQAMAAAIPASDARAQTLAGQWMTMFSSYAGKDPAADGGT